MADFHTHITVSGILGCGYAAAGMMAGMPESTSLVAGGLCGVAGMLPDVDSDSGIPRREAMGFAAAIVPMLLVDRFQEFQLSLDQMVLAAAGLYVFIRFVAARLIGRWSVHRGMWHSIPAVLIFAGLAFLMSRSEDLTLRYFKAFAVGLGALSHLILDEVYSVDTRGIVPKFKKSFGTAVKLWGKNGWANFSTYAKLAVVTAAILIEPSVLSRLEQTSPEFAGRLQNYGERLQGYRQRIGAYARPDANRDPQATGAPGPPSPAPQQTPLQPAPAGPAPLPGYGQPFAPQSAPANAWPAATPSGPPVQPFSAQGPMPTPAIRRR